jgi:hypothetical protein
MSTMIWGAVDRLTGIQGSIAMNKSIRPVLLALAFAATVAGGVSALTLRGETKEAGIVDACAGAAWPRIPAQCLDGGRRADVRVIADLSNANPEPVSVSPTIEARFSSDFE